LPELRSNLHDVFFSVVFKIILDQKTFQGIADDEPSQLAVTDGGGIFEKRNAKLYGQP
jgi:hypothetical protein